MGNAKIAFPMSHSKPPPRHEWEGKPAFSHNGEATLNVIKLADTHPMSVLD
jgi:hypothetical protein